MVCEISILALILPDLWYRLLVFLGYGVPGFYNIGCCHQKGE